jgi:hypothetical protein
LQGITPLRLGTAVPPVGGWRLAALPPRVTAADVERLLDSCDRGTSRGVRIYRPPRNCFALTASGAACEP